MAEQERMTKKERRAASREDRKRKEEEARRKARKQNMISGLSTLAVVAVIGLVVWTAFAGGEDVISDVQISTADAEAAKTAAGCEVIEETVADTTHYEPNTAPALSIMYPSTRPPAGGPHFSQFNNFISNGADNQLDERSTTHNLEHGAIIAWYDPEQVSGDDIGAMESWSGSLNTSGFRGAVNGNYSGGSIFVSPFTDPGISSGKAVAFRAWGVSMDCDEWNETAANSFVIDNYGTHGASPERNFSQYPEEALGYSDTTVEDNTEAPTGDRTVEPSQMDPGSESPTAGETSTSDG